MLNITQLRDNVIKPTLLAIDAHSQVAEDLVLGTALQESNLHYLRQLGNGPARGIYQMEPATHNDIWKNYLTFHTELSKKVSTFLVLEQPPVNQLIWNLAYATAMCRIHYLRVPKALPHHGDINALGEYWKQYYNTPLGRGTVQEFVWKFKEYIET